MAERPREGSIANSVPTVANTGTPKAESKHAIVESETSNVIEDRPQNCLDQSESDTPPSDKTGFGSGQTTKWRVRT